MRDNCSRENPGLVRRPIAPHQIGQGSLPRRAIATRGALSMANMLLNISPPPDAHIGASRIASVLVT
eukprot:1151036-Pelagomonas_calceolata.AAC.5